MALRRSEHRPKVIVMSGGSTLWAAALAAARHLGAAAILSKPYAPAELIAAIRAALTEASPVTPVQLQEAFYRG